MSSRHGGPRPLVLVNPRAGRGRIARLRQFCAEAGVEAVVTDSAAEAAGRAREAAAAGCKRIIAAGGDGTVHHILNGIAGTAAALGIIPLGSGNDIARNLGLPRDFHAAARLALSGPLRRVDLGRVAGRCFLAVAGFGLDEPVNAVANQRPGLARLLPRGVALYTYATLHALARYRAPGVEIETDAGEYRGPVMLVAVSNGAAYGGGMRIAPQADMTDGLLDVCIVADMPRARLLRFFPGVFRGTHLRHAEVTSLRVSRVRAWGERPLAIFADGELAARTPADFDVLPLALSIAAS